MGLFVEVTGETATILQGGVYKQTKLYMRDGYYYAGIGGGFVRLNSDGSTSKPNCRLDTITTETFTLARDKLGRLCDSNLVRDAILLPTAQTEKLLGIASVL